MTRPRAYRAGVSMAKSIGEMVNLMYQKNTARNFYAGLMYELKRQIDKFLLS